MNDERFSITTRIERPAAEVFAWHERPGALARLCPPWERLEIVAAPGHVRDGARVTVRNKVGPLWLNWEVEHRDYVAGVQFRDVQLRGPFAKWEHTHRFTPAGATACRLTDEIVYRLPLGGVGRGLVQRRLERLFRWRHATTKADLELAAGEVVVTPRRVLIAGASGLVGRTLVPFLQTQGHTVLRLVRRSPRSADEVFWDPARGALDAAAIEGVDAIVNLAGENVGAGRWTESRREGILRSRVDATRTLVEGIAKSSSRPGVLVNASANGIYGDRGDEVLRETSSLGTGFLAEVCRKWENEAARASAFGVRAACLRFGVVLTPAGGALGKMLPVFRAGLGGRLGSGRQWLSWVGIDDAVAAIHHAILSPQVAGPVNVGTARPVTNAELTTTLGVVLNRPTFFPVPAAVLRAIFGQMADETVLASTRMTPDVLTRAGFAFRHPDLESALRHAMGCSRARERADQSSAP